MGSGKRRHDRRLQRGKGVLPLKTRAREQEFVSWRTGNQHTRGILIFCCSNCFAHSWLKKYVNEHSDSTGICDFCGSENVRLLSVNELAGPFRNMLSMYVVADTFESGEPLLYLIQWRWDVFDDDLPEGKQETLLEEIVNSDWDDDDGEDRLDAKELYMPKASQWFHNTHSDTWEQFCSDVRDDPGATIPFDEFIAEELAESEETLRAGKSLVLG